MFKKIGKKVPDHHLLFFSSVLTVLFFIVLFNPFYSPVVNKEVDAAPQNVSIPFSKELNSDYSASHFITKMDEEGDYIYVLVGSFYGDQVYRIQKSDLELNPATPIIDTRTGGNMSYSAIFVDDTGIYLGAQEAGLGDWHVEKFRLTDFGNEWTTAPDPSGINAGYPFSIIRDGAYIYVLGSTGTYNRGKIVRLNASDGLGVMDENWGGVVSVSHNFGGHELITDSEFIYGNIGNSFLKIRKSDLLIEKSFNNNPIGGDFGPGFSLLEYNNYLYVLMRGDDCGFSNQCLYRFNKDLVPDLGPFNALTLSSTWFPQAYHIEEQNGQIFYSEFLDVGLMGAPLLSESRINEIDPDTLLITDSNTINFNTGFNGIHAADFFLEDEFIYNIDRSVNSQNYSHIAKIDNPFYIAPPTSVTCNSCASCSTALNNAGENGTVVLINDLNELGSCIDSTLGFLQDNITFDCDNHLISGTGPWDAIKVNASGNKFNLKNCNIDNFSIAVNIEAAPYIDIENVNTDNTANRAFYLMSSVNMTNVTVKNNTGGEAIAIAGDSILDNIYLENIAFTGVRLLGPYNTVKNSSFIDVNIAINTHHYNIFYGNYFGTSTSIIETGDDNEWFFGTTGNHWEDYNSSPELCFDVTPVDGICDAKYEVFSGSGNYDEYPVYSGGPDSTLPNVAIEFPSDTGSYTTMNNSEIVSGTASDIYGIQPTTWENTVNGDSGILGAAFDWSFNANNLEYGINEIIVTATDTNGLTNTATINIYYLPPGGELIGYAWTETIGWISMSSRNNVGPFSYGVKIDANTGHLSGYGWSENVGWVSFQHGNAPEYTANPPAPYGYNFNTNCFTYDDGDSTNDCTNTNNCIACYTPKHDATGLGGLYGWANVLALEEDGWIRLDDHNGTIAPNYGIEYSMSDNEFTGFAWNGANSSATEEAAIGWISYNCLNDGSCASSGYKVGAHINMPPSVTFDQSLAIRNLPCISSDGLDGACSTDCENHPEIYWDFFDPEDYDQSRYHFILDTDGDPETGGSILDIDENSDQSHVIPTDPPHNKIIDYEETYYAHIKVWDHLGLESPWETISFTTDLHDYPDVFFDWFVEEGSAQEEILFWDQTIYHQDTNNNSSIPGQDWYAVTTREWSTTVSGTDIPDPTLATTTATYPFEGIADMTLKITDNVGICSTSTSLDINKRLPNWIEIK